MLTTISLLVDDALSVRREGEPPVALVHARVWVPFEGAGLFGPPMRHGGDRRGIPVGGARAYGAAARNECTFGDVSHEVEEKESQPSSIGLLPNAPASLPRMHARSRFLRRTKPHPERVV
jgi:hypothetical protein